MNKQLWHNQYNLLMKLKWTKHSWQIKDGLTYKLTMKAYKYIHGEASSSTLVEDLASHANERHNWQRIKV